MPTQERLTLTYCNLSKPFFERSSEFNRQYCAIYNVRLKQMTAMLQERIAKKWGTQYPVMELHKVPENDFEKCVIVGTLFKDQKLKPSLLRQMMEAKQMQPHSIPTHFTDESDQLFIENEKQRYQLVGLDCQNLVTGITCALLISDIGKGKLMVHEICFADCQTQIEHPVTGDDRFVVLISGLNLIHIQQCELQLQLFINWIGGVLGNINDVEIAKIARVIIAGNSVRKEPAKTEATHSLVSKTVVPNDSVEAAKLLDSVLHRLVQMIDVDIMPGSYDFSNHILPQKPMHRLMFPKAYAYKSLNLVSNPYKCEIDGMTFLGSAGEPVTDLMNFSDIGESIDALESCLKWGHLAPSAPDTLGCYPYHDRDPFVITNCPHVMFAGNQEKFGTKLATGEDGQVVRLICIPEFNATFTAVILNLKNLECLPISFNVDL